MSVGKGSINRALKTGVASAKKAEPVEVAADKKEKQSVETVKKTKTTVKKATAKKPAAKKSVTKQSSTKKVASVVAAKEPVNALSVTIYEVGQELPIYLM